MAVSVKRMIGGHLKALLKVTGCTAEIDISVEASIVQKADTSEVIESEARRLPDDIVEDVTFEQVEDLDEV